MHITTARVGYGVNAIVAERWTYKGDDLHAAYDTRQIFTSNWQDGCKSVLPPWDHVPPVSLLNRIKAWYKKPRLPVVLHKPKLEAVRQLMDLPPQNRIRALRQIGLC
jgi:hypothetical protein